MALVIAPADIQQAFPKDLNFRDTYNAISSSVEICSLARIPDMLKLILK